MNNYIAIDPGMGAVKIWDANGGHQLPSFVSVAGGTTYAAMLGTGRRKKARLVEFGGRQYYVGPHAHNFGRPIENMGYDRLTGSPEIQALIYGALTDRIDDHGPYSDSVDVLVALPVEMMTSATNADNASKVKAFLKGSHAWTVDGKQYGVTVNKILITSQPVGAMFDYVLSNDGKIITGRKGSTTGEIGVISVGFNTLEIMCVNNKVLVDRLTSGSTTGVRRLLRNIDAESRYTLGELDERLRAGNLDIAPEAVHEWARELTGQIEATWGETWKRFDSIVMVGGGAMLLNGQLSGYFGNRVFVPDEPITSIARGLYKFAVGRGR